MDESSEIKPSDIGNEVLENSDIAALNHIPEVEAIEKNNLSACGYSGDAELDSLKKELVDSDVKEPDNSLSNKPESSSCETALNQDFEMDDEIELNYEMSSDDSEWSSGVGSYSDASSDSSNASVHSFKKNDEPIEEQVENKLNLIDVANSSKIMLDESLELGNVKNEDNGTFSGNVKSESNSKNLTESSITLDFKTNTVLKQEIKDEAEPSCMGGLKQDEAEPSCIADGSKQDETEEYPIMKFTGKIKLRESNPYEFVVPFIGKKIDWGDHKPCPINSEIARAINEAKFEQNGRYIPDMSYREYMEKRLARTKEEIERDDQRDQFIAIKQAAFVMKNLEKILFEMQEDEPNEEAMIECFDRFLKVFLTPLAAIHIPQFVHTVMYIRSCPEFSLNVRRSAQDCFDKIHVLFPIPDKYNFETVYTNAVQKCLPEGLDGMYDFLMVYDDELEWESEDEMEWESEEDSGLF